MRSEDEKVRALIAQQAAEWHVAHSEGPLSPQQARAFMHWVRTSPMHVAEYLTIAGVARDAAGAARASVASVEDLMAEEGDSVRLLPRNNDAHAHASVLTSYRGYDVLAARGMLSHRAHRRPFVRWATAAATLAVVSIVLLAASYWLAPKAHVESFTTRRGEERSLHLPDNTLVQLDSDSAVAVNYDDHHRRVTITRGQAYFKVAKDATRPFSVRAGQSLIRDVGTTFDVYRQENGTTITVAEGRVQVWNAPPHSRLTAASWLPWAKHRDMPQRQPIVTLNAGEQAVIAVSGLMQTQGTADLQQALAWTQGNIAFDNRSVAAVAAEFNRYNNVQISVEDARIGALPISGMFNAHDVSTFVAFLGTMPGVHVKRNGQRILVSASRAQEQHHE